MPAVCCALEPRPTKAVEDDGDFFSAIEFRLVPGTRDDDGVLSRRHQYGPRQVGRGVRGTR